MKIVAISDLHGNLPDLPGGDLLLCAGDVCPDFVAKAPQRAWFVDAFLPWFRNFPGEAYTTLGNHDHLPKPVPRWEKEHGKFIKVDELVEFQGVRIWFSPWSEIWGSWSWQTEPEDMRRKFTAIPYGTDIIVSHAPPYGYGDYPDPRYTFNNVEHVGSKELLGVIGRVRPKLVICGHIHGGYGSYDMGGTLVYNVSLVNEALNPVHEPVVIDYEEVLRACKI